MLPGLSKRTVIQNTYRGDRAGAVILSAFTVWYTLCTHSVLVAVHLAAHAGPDYSRSKAGRRLQHTLSHNLHESLRRGLWLWQREGERGWGREWGRESAAVMCLFPDCRGQSTGNAPRCDQSQLNIFSDKESIFFCPLSLSFLTLDLWSPIMHLVKFD